MPVLVEPDPTSLAMIAATALACAIAAALGMAAVILRAQHAASSAPRLASGAFCVGVAIAVLLTLLETPAGPLAALVAAALLLARSEVG